MGKILIIGAGSNYEKMYIHNKNISSEPPKPIQNDSSTHNEIIDASKLDIEFIPNLKIRSKYKRNLKYK